MGLVYYIKHVGVGFFVSRSSSFIQCILFHLLFWVSDARQTDTT